MGAIALCVALIAGCVAELLVAGAGSRLVMRLLALTSRDVEGSFTEADEVVGDISLDGTLALIVFGGLPAGLLTGVAGFTAVAVLEGMVVVAVANRLGVGWPRPTTLHRIAVVVVLLVALPGFVTALADILDSKMGVSGSEPGSRVGTTMRGVEMAGNVETIKGAFDAFHNGDAEGMKAAWADDISWEGSGSDEIPGGGTHQGTDDVLAALGSIRERWESFEAHPDEFIEQGDTVVVLGHVEGRANGNDVKAPFVHIWRMQDGKAKRVQALTDTLEVGRALGVA